MDTNWLSFFNSTLPLMIILGTGLLVLVFGLFIGRKGNPVLLILSLVGIAAAFISSLNLWKMRLFYTGGMLTLDPFALFFYVLILMLGMLTCLNHFSYFEKRQAHYPEIYSLTLFALSGMMVMVSSTHLLTFFLGLEVMSLPLYTLAGIHRRDIQSNESAMKYFILGAMIAGIFLYGSALIYGATGSLDLKNLSSSIISAQNFWLLKVGALLILVTFAFKIAAFPFHFWTPDVYQGAPVSVTGFMATAVKVASFGAMIRVLSEFMIFPQIPILKILTVLSLLSMVVGNLIALYQTNIKRMLAYSSIANAGYILVGVIVALSQSQGQTMSWASPLFYLFGYAVMSMGAFSVASLIATETSDAAEAQDYAGLSKRSPILAAIMTVFMLALTGIPPTVGFAGKFFIFREAVHQGLYPLVIVGVLMSAVSAYYYLRVIVTMYFGKSENEGQAPLRWSTATTMVILFCVVSVFYMGFCPSRYVELSKMSTLKPQNLSFLAK